MNIELCIQTTAAVGPPPMERALKTDLVNMFSTLHFTTDIIDRALDQVSALQRVEMLWLSLFLFSSLKFASYTCNKGKEKEEEKKVHEHHTRYKLYIAYCTNLINRNGHNRLQTSLRQESMSSHRCYAKIPKGGLLVPKPKHLTTLHKLKKGSKSKKLI